MIRSRRAVMLVQLLGTMALASILLVLLARLVIGGIRTERLAAERMQRREICAHFLAHLRRDALATQAFEWRAEEHAWVLILALGSDGTPTVQYEFLGRDASRRVDGRQTDAWVAPRLLIEANLNRDHHRPLLDVNFVEYPPMSKRERLPRETHVLVNLPTRMIGAKP
ncbi:MAG: hypothetical protein ACKVS9_09425 [Phycisphaerae bacterium]